MNKTKDVILGIKVLKDELNKLNKLIEDGHLFAHDLAELKKERDLLETFIAKLEELPY